MTDKYLIPIGILMAIFILLPIFSRLLVPFNLAVRELVGKYRDMRIRPLMVFTHRYNDFLSFSIQLLLLGLLLDWFGTIGAVPEYFYCDVYSDHHHHFVQTPDIH